MYQKLNVISRALLLVLMMSASLFAISVEPTEIAGLDAIVPSPWQYTIQKTPGTIGAPDSMHEALFSIFFSIPSESQSIKLYFYSINDKTVDAVIQATRMLSSCIPVRYDRTPTYTILSSPCYLNSHTWINDSLFNNLDSSLHKYFKGFRFEPECLVFTPSVFSGVPDVDFSLCNTLQVQLINERINSYRSIALMMSATSELRLEGLGYRGIFAKGESVFVGKSTIFLLRNGTYLSGFKLPDPRSELERMIIRIGINENIHGLVAWRMPFADVIPDSLKLAENRCGILEIPIMSDSMAIDFSLADTSNGVTASKSIVWFPDLLLYHPIYHSNPGILYAQRLTKGDTGSIVQFDANTAGTFSPPSLPDSISAKYMAMLKERQFSSITGTSDVNKYIVKTTEGGTAFWYPIGHYTGAIGRVFVAYSFSTDDLSSFTSGTIFKNKVVKQNYGKTDNKNAGTCKIDLSGKTYPARFNGPGVGRAKGIVIDKSRVVKQIISK